MTLPLPLMRLNFFFSKAMLRPCPALDDIKKIHAIVDGWPGGLALMVESLHGIPDLSRLPDRLTSEAFDYFFRRNICNPVHPCKKFSSYLRLCLKHLDPEISLQYD